MVHRKVSTSKSGRVATGKIISKKTLTKSVKSSGAKKAPKKKTAKKSRVRKKDVSLRSTSSKKKLPAVLSPYRFPIDIDKLAIATARYAGVFFVATGAFFTLFYSDFTFSSSENSLPLSGAVTMSQEVDCPAMTSFASGECNNATPEVTLEVDVPSVSKQLIDVVAKVDDATEVTLSAYYITGGYEVDVGTMNRISDDEWKLSVDTSQYEDGEYKFKTFVKNQYTSYERTDNIVRVVENEPLVTTDNVTTQIQTGETQDSVEIKVDIADISQDPISRTTIRVDKDSPVDGKLLITINAEGVEKIKLYTYNNKTNSERLLGYAYRIGGEWRFAWDTTQVDDGEYKILAQIFTRDGESVTEELSVKIENNAKITSDQTASDVSFVDENLSSLLDPDVTISLQENSPISERVQVMIEVENSDSIELYTVNKFSATQHYLGTAQRVDTNLWSFVWDTVNTPNGEVRLMAKVQNKYGSKVSFGEYITINNKKTILTERQIESVNLLKDAGDMAKRILDTQKDTVAETENTLEEGAHMKKEDTLFGDIDSLELTEEDREIAEVFLNVFDESDGELDEELQRLASAIRSEDQDSVDYVKDRIKKLKEEILHSALSQKDTEILAQRIDTHISKKVSRVEKDVVATNKIVEARIEDAISLDTDSDGITDYDEVNIYNTDPYVADSDNDGFTDGVEILSGYDPTNADAEAVIEFESPQESGIVREDILSVDSITTAAVTDEESSLPPKGIISGRGLPNSYVTVYIFSTPVVVTVKTDDDGSWQYRFDKELEDGEHEVYVGITDNAGKIIAKSKPLLFVKEAQAFTPVEDPIISSTIIETEENSFISSYMIYLVLSISVVAIGLVLILLGLHLDTRRKLVVVNRDASVPV